mmetsp:Transcript_30411/g.76798  ORF Transcript_30411/g.76798 Transcript_30411/m.76798 type:complete len:239 (+) Transcript_30411:3-719(+)
MTQRGGRPPIHKSKSPRSTSLRSAASSRYSLRRAGTASSRRCRAERAASKRSGRALTFAARRSLPAGDKRAAFASTVVGPAAAAAADVAASSSGILSSSPASPPASSWRVDPSTASSRSCSRASSTDCAHNLLNSSSDTSRAFGEASLTKAMADCNAVRKYASSPFSLVGCLNAATNSRLECNRGGFALITQRMTRGKKSSAESGLAVDPLSSSVRLRTSLITRAALRMQTSLSRGAL